MRDIPVFATEFGVGSLMLKEIPYKETAYIRIHDATDPEEFLKECIGFCKAAGAEHVYATGHRCLESRSQYTSIVVMERSLIDLPETDAQVTPVNQENAEHWKLTYNKKMERVPNAATMNRADVDALIDRGAAYWVHCGNTPLGIGIANGSNIDALAAIEPGAGKDVLLALCGVLQGDKVSLEVASTNTRAIRLYERLGFTATAEKTRWYKIF